MTDKNDAIVIGAGIAGLGVSALLHQVELGDACSSSELMRRVDKEVDWARFSETVEIFKDGRWRALEEMIIASPSTAPRFVTSPDEMRRVSCLGLKPWPAPR